MMPKWLAQHLAEISGVAGNLADLSDRALAALAAAWTLKPAGSEDYRTAEVTLGGVGLTPPA